MKKNLLYVPEEMILFPLEEPKSVHPILTVETSRYTKTCADFLHPETEEIIQVLKYTRKTDDVDNVDEVLRLTRIKSVSDYANAMDLVVWRRLVKFFIENEFYRYDFSSLRNFIETLDLTSNMSADDVTPCLYRLARANFEYHYRGGSSKGGRAEAFYSFLSFKYQKKLNDSLGRKKPDSFWVDIPKHTLELFSLKEKPGLRKVDLAMDGPNLRDRLFHYREQFSGIKDYKIDLMDLAMKMKVSVIYSSGRRAPPSNMYNYFENAILEINNKYLAHYSIRKEGRFVIITKKGKVGVLIK